jgi:hypothetical protein
MNWNHNQTRFQIRFFLHPFPIFPFETVQNIRVDEDEIRALIDVGGSQTYVLDKRPTSLVQSNVVDDIGHDKVIGASFVINSLKIDRVAFIE